MNTLFFVRRDSENKAVGVVDWFCVIEQAVGKADKEVCRCRDLESANFLKSLIEAGIELHTKLHPETS